MATLPDSKFQKTARDYLGGGRKGLFLFGRPFLGGTREVVIVLGCGRQQENRLDYGGGAAELGRSPE